MCIRDSYNPCCVLEPAHIACLVLSSSQLLVHRDRPALSIALHVQALLCCSRVQVAQGCCAVLLPGAAPRGCLLYTSDAADEEDSVDLGGRRIIKKKKKRD
eukprot:TRINITY_DN2843_c0_g1_i8.p1 TRINITY_DN2843_c0_g1~~TRINITY_DN2843_c0_g1_i8.p1  ORF type:complete len:101 (+),score=20.97 TRINITY_DN2843_c0_g1_i8:98-400(+)